MKTHTILYIILAAAFILTLGYSFKKGVELYEAMECLRWQDQSEIYKNFYWTDWQIEQCRHYGFKINQ